jgi:sulfite exporter TauE/SafE
MDPVSVIALLHTGLDVCQVTVDRHGSLLAVLLWTGAFGGWSHCAGMCGPFVLSQVGARLEGLPAGRMREWHRISGALLLPYHAGRATTYATLGGAAAGFAGRFGALSGVRWLSAALLTAAALVLLSAAVGRLWGGGGFRVGRWGARSGAAGGWWSDGVARLARPLFGPPGGPGPVGWRGYLLGLALGLLPCGLVYGALAVAAATADPLAGAAGMLAFSAGTVPALLAVGLAGHAAGQRWRGAAARITPLVMLANALVLGAIAWRMVVVA